MQMPSWMQSRVQCLSPSSAWTMTGPGSHLNYNNLVTAVVAIVLVNRDLHFDVKLNILTKIIRLQNKMNYTNLYLLNRKNVLGTPR